MVAKTAYDSDLTPAEIHDLTRGMQDALGRPVSRNLRIATFDVYRRDDYYADRTTFFAVLCANNTEFFETPSPYELGKMCAAVMALESNDAGSPR